jgi:hypothetical protein
MQLTSSIYYASVYLYLEKVKGNNMVERYISDFEARREQQYVDAHADSSNRPEPIWTHVAPSNSESERPSDTSTTAAP